MRCNMEPKYKRILLKVSGEALAGDKKTGLNYDAITEICKSIKKCSDAGVQVAIVVGGGNFWRGRSSELWTEHVPTTSVCLQQQ